MSIADLKKDATRLRERLGKLTLPPEPEKAIEALRRELANNFAPLLEALMGGLQDEVIGPVDDLAAAVDEMIEQTEDVLHAETTAKVLGVFVAGAALVGELERLLPKADEADRARLAPAIAQYRAASQEVAATLQEITIDDDGPDDEAIEEGGSQ